MALTVTLSDAQTNLAKWVAASAALAEGQSFGMGGRTLTLSDAAQVREMISYWSGIEANLLTAQATGKTRRAGFSLAKFC